jgi:hypothetical protein
MLGSRSSSQEGRRSVSRRPHGVCLVRIGMPSALRCGAWLKHIKITVHDQNFLIVQFQVLLTIFFWHS